MGKSSQIFSGVTAYFRDKLPRKKIKRVDLQEGNIIDFYQGDRTDHKGRTLSQIRSWDYDLLEHTHDYIQWLFPSRKKSRFNPRAPILDNQQIATFRNTPTLQAELAESFRVILAFYGFQYEQENDRIRVFKSSRWDDRKRVWLTRGNHNFLRITRVLKSLHTLGLGSHARAFYRALSEIYDTEGKDIIGQKTFDIWGNAAGR